MVVLSEEEEVVAQDPFYGFPSKIQNAVNGLAWLGHLENEVSYGGHSFVMRTLKADDDLIVASLTQEYMETLGQAKAWAMANVALSLKTVDGDSEFCTALGPDRLQNGRERFKFVGSWYWPVIAFLFSRFAELNEEQELALNALRDLSVRSRDTSNPSPDFSKDPGDFELTQILDRIED